jgi:hypothetical protein
MRLDSFGCIGVQSHKEDQTYIKHLLVKGAAQMHVKYTVADAVAPCTTE